MKKLLVSALVAAMVLGFGSMAFGAAGDIAPAAFSDIAGHEAEGELTYFFATGVFAGEGDGTVKPDDPLTRAAFCKVVVEAFGKGNMAAALAGLRPNFVDEVPAWAWGYVNVATYMGVINGYEDGTFGAGKFVTYGEAVTMLIRALPGHKGMVGAGVWPYNFIFYAVDNGFNGPVDVSFANLPCTRGDMARMLFATLAYVETLEPGEGGAMVEGDTMLEDVLFSGVFNYFDATELEVDGDEFDPADPVYLVGGDEFADVLGRNVVVVVDGEGDAFFVWATGAIETFSGLFDEWEYVDGVYNLIFQDGTKIPVDGLLCELPVTLNQQAGANGCYLEADDECLVTLDANGKAVNVNAFYWDDGEGVVTDAGDADATAGTPAWIVVGGNTYNVPASARVTINGATAGPDDLAINDVVKIAEFGGEDPVIRISAVRNVVEGKVTDTRTVYPGPVDYATIGGTEYTVATGTTAPSRNAYVRYALNHAGELYYDITITHPTPYVVVQGYTDGSAADTVTVDVRGEAVTYTTTFDFSTAIGDYGVLSFLPDGTVDGFTAIAITDEGTDVTFKVVSIGADSFTVQNLVTSAYLFFDDEDITIYQKSGSTITYLGFEGLTVNMILDTHITGGADDYMIWEYVPVG